MTQAQIRLELRPSQIKIGSLASPQSTALIEVESSATFAEGHLFFHRDRTLMAQPFDVATRTLTGEPFPVVERVGSEGSRYVSFSASAVGTLAYAGGGAFGSQLTWRDRAGKQLGTLGELAFYSSVALSPDGSRAVVASHSNLVHLIVERLAGVKLTPLTDADYDRLVVVTLQDGRGEVVVLKYGEK